MFFANFQELQQNHARAASLHCCGFLGVPAVIRASLEQIPLREILLLEEILG
jgi:hypothetical protein